MTEKPLQQDMDDKEKIPVIKKSEEEQPASITEEKGREEIALPDVMPILPLRGLVVYPQTAVPLLVGQARSIRLIDDVAGTTKMIGLAMSKNPEDESPEPDNIHNVGTAAVIHRLFRAPDGTIRLLVQGLARIRIDEYTETDPYLKARVSLLPEETTETLETEALSRSLSDQFRHFAELVPSIPEDLLAVTMSIEDPLQLVYSMATYIRMDLGDAQKLLELDEVEEKLRMLTGLMGKEIEVLELGRKIQADAQSEIDKVQREYYLREQMKAIQRELGEADETQVEVDEFRKKIEEGGLPEEARKEALRELDRLAKLPSAAAEYGVIRTYLDWITSVPWNVATEDNLDIAHAREVLEADHYGLEDVKERILEFLAVRKLRRERSGEDRSETVHDFIRNEREGVILCFVGPPGVGKTSVGASIARAMGRKFMRMSLGGVKDEAEIRGHRRTYIGAMPGQIIQALRRVGSRNPVIMLDEIDKLGMDFRGDPASALLEVLDPEQNTQFRDHYLDVPFDLSQVMFITTANILETVPPPLRDRMEILELTGYTEGEKLEIAKHYLIPRQVKENGLHEDELVFTDDAIKAIIQNYTREAGVRSLEREIGAVCRKAVVDIAEGKTGSITIDPEKVAESLGKPRYYYIAEIEDRTTLPGIATGLVWTPVGGDIIFIEAAKMPGGKGFLLTGKLGDVMRESAQAALTYIRAHEHELGIPSGWFTKHDIHLHVPAGAVPKDGPSAGITIAVALASLLTGRPVHSHLAMTGEITLRGKVLPVGGIKEKVLAAHRVGLKTVILPRRNEKDIEDIPEEIRNDLEFILVDTVDEVFARALGGKVEEPFEGEEPGEERDGEIPVTPEGDADSATGTDN